MKLKFYIDSVEVKDMNGKPTGEKRARLLIARRDEETGKFGKAEEISFAEVPPVGNVDNVSMAICVEYVDDQVNGFINALRPFFTVNSTNVTTEYMLLKGDRSYDPEAFLRTLPPNCFKTISCFMMFNEMWNQLVDDQAPFFLDMPGKLKMINQMDDFMFTFDDSDDDEASKSDDSDEAANTNSSRSKDQIRQLLYGCHR